MTAIAALCFRLEKSHHHRQYAQIYSANLFVQSPDYYHGKWRMPNFGYAQFCYRLWSNLTASIGSGELKT